MFSLLKSLVVSSALVTLLSAYQFNTNANNYWGGPGGNSQSNPGNYQGNPGNSQGNPNNYQGNPGNQGGGNANNYNGGGGGGNAQSSGSPAGLPRLPNEAILTIHGKYVKLGFNIQGYFYYSASLRKWRFDNLFYTDPKSISKYPDRSAIVEFDFVTGNDGRSLSAYHVDPSTFLWTCNLIHLPRFWSPDYLTSARYVGAETLNGINTRVFANDDIWPNGSLLTYVSETSGNIVRHYFQTGDSSLYYDIDNISNEGNNYNWGNTFSIPAGLNNVPCA